MWQTYAAGQRLSLTPFLLSKWNCYTNCCPSSGAGDSHRLHLHIDNTTSQLFPIAGTNHQVILPISSNWGQLLILAFDPQSKLFKTIFARNSLHQGNKSLWTWNLEAWPHLNSFEISVLRCFFLQNQRPTRPVLWIFFPDHSCDHLTHPPVFHPGRRDLPLWKGAVLSWQGWRGAGQFAAPHLAVHALCDWCQQQAWATKPSHTKRGGRGLQSHWLWGNDKVFFLAVFVIWNKEKKSLAVSLQS